MAEPEGVLIDAARWLVDRLRPERAPVEVPCVELLATHRRRLELLLESVFAIELPIRVAQPPAPPRLMERAVRRLPKAHIDTRALPGTDGCAVHLPYCLGGYGQRSQRLYRVMALHQAVRAARLAQWTPPCASALQKDLFCLYEAAAADVVLCTSLPGTVRDLELLHACANEQRQGLHYRYDTQQRMEALRTQARSLLTKHGTRSMPGASESWARAQDHAKRLATEREGYQPLPRDFWWGRLLAASNIAGAVGATDANTPAGSERVATLERTPEIRTSDEDEDDTQVGPWMIQTDDPHEHAEDPQGLRRPADNDDDSEPEALSESVAELPRASQVTSPDPVREILLAEESTAPRKKPSSAPCARPDGRPYPEWDYRVGRYRENAVTVHSGDVEFGDAAWARALMRRRHTLISDVRRQFQKLRAQRQWRRRQPDGETVDIDALVLAYGERRAGTVADDHVYQHSVPARRDVAIMLLVDISGSTDAWVDADMRIIDVEKEALLVVSEALQALGDAHAIFVFSGETASRVCVDRVRGFDDRESEPCRRRIAALAPQRFTRTGAAIRHASTLLAARPERKRLLLVISDGKPNDADGYEGRYGVEDTRQAVREARDDNIESFCITVDRQAPVYMPAVFGANGYTVLRNPANLAARLVHVLRRMLE
ncbi:Nitric oxide reductase NorD protein [Salinisphaera shabanensis E1L3A]|uniref:Nitric oxide reductase NorD protein n=1 Tax=Salinisphaera shabanensis E1L3A TaxID=1033802 RepID=U2EIR7_9GAMM|nr:VWA domain-containing protein [Salinisphaera shabanensis]ERJ18237.1 Nitric oxide reductase NorD protein [Salinisphaera shabanensis E1L3A]